ncbi:zonadhesin-like [Hemitrygon akajei]|uniref:zonadhesin-like n=1 Tax=Hemitrygon akajei TaxID=2704970 RepID=UPI003BF9D7A5
MKISRYCKLTVILGLFTAASGFRHGKQPAPISHQNGNQLYQTEPVVLTACNFNDNTKPFCDWTQATGDDGDWSRIAGKSPTQGTGPPGDYPDGSGYYIYQEADDFSKGQFVRLDSPTLTVSGEVCVEFQYYMYGADFDNALKVYLKESSTEKQIWSKTGFQSPSWLHGMIDHSFKTPTNIKVIFESVRGSTASSDTAVDNIKISTGPCSDCINSCNFDEYGNLCGWTNEQNPPLVPFDQWNGQTDTENSGPDDDYSKPGFGYYMLMDSTVTMPGDRSHLRSPMVHCNDCLTLRFHYFMYGTATKMELNVYAVKQGKYSTGDKLGNPLFSLTGNQLPGWKLAKATYRGKAQVQLQIPTTADSCVPRKIHVHKKICSCWESKATHKPVSTTTKPPLTTPQTTTTKRSTAPDSTTTTASLTGPKTTTTQRTTNPGSCPPNSHYDPCGAGCSPRCDRPTPDCPGGCVSGGCVCNEGFYKRGDRCVPADQCGCIHNGTYYQVLEL